MIITSFKELQDEAQSIYNFTLTVMSEDMTEAVLRGNDLIVYISRTGKMLADAKYWLSAKKQDETMELIDRLLSKEKLSAKVQNSLLDSICKDEQYLVDFIERLHRSCTHQMEWCRSVVSKGKEEMRLSNIGGEFRR